MLAAYPEVQDWIAEEIDWVLGSQIIDIRDYEATFPKLRRCLSVLVRWRFSRAARYIPTRATH